MFVYSTGGGDLFEISMVAAPANPDTWVTGHKGLEPKTDGIRASSNSWMLALLTDSGDDLRRSERLASEASPPQIASIPID